jgi:hypothetical protein
MKDEYEIEDLPRAKISFEINDVGKKTRSEK